MAGNRIAVIDHGTGNLFSVAHALEKVGAKSCFISTPEAVLQADRIILPGVGAFADGMAALSRLNLTEPLKEASKNTPVLGICLGMQMLFDSSEEMGESQGLGLIGGRVKRIPDKDDSGKSIKIPHIGWNSLNRCNTGRNWRKTILDGVKEGESVYFVHSYAPVVSNEDDCLASTEYGTHHLSIAVQQNHIYGCQFHPERSGPTGLHILSNFISI